MKKAFFIFVTVMICLSGCAEKINVDSVTLDPASLSLYVDEGYTLQATILPENAKYGATSWSSSDPSVVCVDDSGYVLGVSAGRAAVTASAGGRKASCNIIVKIRPLLEKTVYVSGYKFNNNYKTVAVLWVNGAQQELTDGINYASAESVFVSEKVYAAGYEYNSQGVMTATLWIDGTATRLTDGTKNAKAISVFANGGTVYVAGYEANENKRNVASIWVDGVTHRLSDGNTNAEANSVFVSGGKVYAAGYEYTSKFIINATLWIDGSASKLMDDSVISAANSVYVSSAGDVYVAGSYETAEGLSKAALWINGEMTTLSGDANPSSLNSVFITDDILYAAGYYGKPMTAVLLENGALNYLPKTYYESLAYSVMVSGMNTYVAGYEAATNETRAALWIDGAAQTLEGSGRSIARSVFVQ